MNLREAEAFRVLDDHDGRSGHMNPHFHDRCAYEEMDPACPEFGHHGFPFLGGQSAVHQPDPIGGAENFREFPSHVRGILQIQFL
jgi:hypothetical protein